jgi:peptidylprolyl isomerase
LSCQDGSVARCDERKAVVKKRFAVALSASVVVGLSGCSSEATFDYAAAVAEGCTPSGAEVETIQVDGAFGETPTVTFKAPLDVDATQRAVVAEGAGDTVATEDRILIDFAFFNAATGEQIFLSGYDELSPIVLPLDTSTPVFSGFSFTAVCSTVGSRVVGLIPAAEAFGEEGAPPYGMEPGEGLVFVVDVIAIKPPLVAPLERVEGVAAELEEGFPAVTFDELGEPTVEIPEGEVPSEFALQTLITGNGDVVAGEDVVVVQYRGVNWNTGVMFDSSWQRGEPAEFRARGVVPGFRDALVGQTVGSRVVVTIPANLGYGRVGGNPDAGIGPEDTIFFVIDILGVK